MGTIELASLFIIQVTLFIISAIAKSECDTIRFKPQQAWYQNDWWLGKRPLSQRNWWFKYPLSFAWDGWHLMEFQSLF